MKHLLLIDDDEKLGKLLQEYFAQFDFAVLHVTTPDAGLKALQKMTPELVILDVMLPGRSGFEVLRDIRSKVKIPVLMLSARGDLTDRIVGLEMGADDYLPKPFDPRELLARVQSILRRAEPTPVQGDLMDFEGILIDVAARAVTVDTHRVELSTSEFDLLVLLARNRGQVMSRQDILDSLRGVEWQSDNRSVDVVLSRLRSKLGETPRNPRFFKTVWGSGYSFVAAPRVTKKVS